MIVNIDRDRKKSEPTKFVTVKRVLDYIAETKKLNDKIEILNHYKDMNVLRKTFYYAYNKDLKYYIKKVPKYWESKLVEKVNTNAGFLTIENEFEGIQRLFKTLYNKKVVGNNAIQLVSTMLRQFTFDSQQVIVRILERNLQCDIGIQSINKVWINLI